MAEGNTIQECRTNRFVFEIDGVDLPSWIVSEVSYCNGKLVVAYREIRGMLSSEFFDNNDEKIVGKNATIKYLDREGNAISEAVFTGVCFEQMQMDDLSYKEDKPLLNFVYFRYDSVRHRSL